MEEDSAIDVLNEAFINEPSTFLNPTTPLLFGDIKLRFDDLEIRNFSITELLEKHSSLPGRKTQHFEKPFF